MGVTKMRVVCVALLVVSMVWLYACGGGSKGTGLNIVSGSGGTTGEVVSNKLPGLRVKAIDPTALKVEQLYPNLPIVALYGTTITGMSLAAPVGSDKIAFASHRPGNYEIFLIDPDRPEYLQRSTFIPQNDYYPAWSPDGSKIAFTSYKTGNGDIYIMNPDGSNLQGPIAASSSLEAYPSFSPDGKRLVFVSSRTGNNEIYIYDFGSGSLSQVTNSPSDEIEPKFTQDGTRIIFASNFDGDYEICSVPATATNASSSSFTKLTNNTVADVDPAVNPQSLRGPMFFYCSAIGSGNTYELMGYFSGGEIVRLTDNSFHDRFPSVSPFGNRVVFSRYTSNKASLILGKSRWEWDEEENKYRYRLVEEPLTNPESFDTHPCWSGLTTLVQQVYVGSSTAGIAPPFGSYISAAIVGRSIGGSLVIGIIAQTSESVKITTLSSVVASVVSNEEGGSEKEAVWLWVDVEADNILKVLQDAGPGVPPIGWISDPAKEIIIVIDAVRVKHETFYSYYGGSYTETSIEIAGEIKGVIATRGRKLQIAQDGGSVVVRGDLIVAQRLHGRGAPTKRNATEVRLSKGARGVDIIAK
jgi:hypothetical protein